VHIDVLYIYRVKNWSLRHPVHLVLLGGHNCMKVK